MTTQVDEGAGMVSDGCVPEHHGAGHGKHHHAHGAHGEKPMSQEEALRSLLVLGQVALESQDYESAVEAYASALKVEPNEVAFYNLGSMCARGLGVRRDFVEAARLLHQAELLGNERAGKLCGKCMLDYAVEDAEHKSAADVYARMAFFVSRVYPEAVDQRTEVCHGLIAVGSTCAHLNDRVMAAKAFRAAAEFGGDEQARRLLGALDLA